MKYVLVEILMKLYHIVKDILENYLIHIIQYMMVENYWRGLDLTKWEH